jgi:hypothetical protein
MVTIDRCDQLVDVSGLVTINCEEDEADDEGQEENAPAKISDASILVEDAIYLGKSVQSISILCNKFILPILLGLVFILTDIVIVVLAYFLVTHNCL